MAGDLRTAVRIDVEGGARFRGEMRRMGRSLDALGGSTRGAARASHGSSPLARGTRGPPPRGPSAIRFIPARAGNTPGDAARRPALCSPVTARHVILLDMETTPDLIWDDEAGTVEGDHWYAAGVREDLARGAPLNLSRDGHILILEDPAHDPRDFWHLLPYWCQVEPLRSRMPALLRDVEPTPRRPRASSSTASSATPSRARSSSGNPMPGVTIRITLDDTEVTAARFILARAGNTTASASPHVA